MNHTVTLHLTEKYTTKDGSPIFEGWMTGSKSEMFGGLQHTHCAMTSQQAIAYKCEVERKAWQLSQDYTTVSDDSVHPTKISSDGTPVFYGIKVEVLIERIS